MATYSCHWLIMGKNENWHLLLSQCRYLNFLQKCFLISPLRFIWILSKSLNLIDCHSNIKDKFSKHYSKINSSEAVRGIKLKLCRIVSKNGLYKICFYCCCSSTLVAMAKYIQKSSSQKLCINVCVIILYINCVFIAVAHVVSLLWQL